MWERSRVPTWGIGSDKRIRFLNQGAEELLGVKSRDAIGTPCNQIVNGLDGDHAPFCCHECPVFAAVHGGCELQPQTLLLGKHALPRWTRLLPILVKSPDGSGLILVESAVDIDRWARVEEYLRKISARDRVRSVGEESKLTRRESQILALLAEGFDQRDLAKRLHIRYSTLRAHVQRILTKLGVSSLQAAIAHELLVGVAEE